MPGHGHRDGHVDAHHAHLHTARELARHAAVTGEAGHAVAELMLVDELQCRGHVGHAHTGQHRAEDLVAVQAHGRRDMVEQGAACEEALLEARHLVAAAVHHQPGTFFNAHSDGLLDAVAGLARDDGAHLGIQLHAIFDSERFRACGQQWHDPVGHVSHQHRHADGHAAFAGRAIGAADEGIHRLADVGVGHHHHVVLGTAQGLHAFAVVGADLVDVPGDGCGANEAQRLDVGMRQQRVHRHLVALHDAEHPVGQACLLQQLSHEDRRAGVAFAGLEDEGVATGQRHREHPHRHHAGEVERRDAGHHAQGLAQCPVVDTRADLVGVVTLEQLGDAARKFDDVDAAADLALGIGEDLAVFGGDHRGQGVFVLVEQGQELVEHPRAADGRHVTPGRLGCLGSGHGVGHIVGYGQQHLARGLAGGGVPHRLGARAAAALALAAYPVADVGRVGEGGGCAHGAVSGGGQNSSLCWVHARVLSKKEPADEAAGCGKSSKGRRWDRSVMRRERQCATRHACSQSICHA